MKFDMFIFVNEDLDFFVARNWGLGTLIDQMKVSTIFNLILFPFYEGFSFVLSF